ncbi:hypothetical protein ACYULU_12990 [Breznakiellaceae bacterium SP9]
MENGYIGQVYTGAALGADRAYPFLDPIPFAGFSKLLYIILMIAPITLTLVFIF